MNLLHFFKTQLSLREKIVMKHNLEGKDLLPNFILSLNVELAELANEWQGFKHWKVNRKPKPGMLEEYADCLSFILEIGIETKLMPSKLKAIKRSSIIEQFNEIYYICADISYCHRKKEDVTRQYYYLFEHFLGLGEMLGFTQKDIEKAYIVKSKINHERQESGY